MIEAFAATGIGSLPGTHPAEAAQIVAGEIGGLPHVAELPARGPGADMVGRTAGMLAQVAEDFAVETTPVGWRFADAPGRAMRRAAQWLIEDLDCFEEHAPRRVVKQQIVGPWTMAAMIEMRNGERAVRDEGACRDIAGALAEVAVGQVLQLRRRCPGAEVIIQVDEPMLRTVLQGGVNTASGLATYRAVDPQRARTALAAVVDAVHGVDARVAVHCCAEEPPLEVMRGSGADLLSVDALLRFDEDHLAEALERGTTLMLGVVGTAAFDVPGVAAVAEPAARRVQRLLDRWGTAPERAGERVILTPACGLAGSPPDWTRLVLRALAEAGRLLRDDGSTQSAGDRAGERAADDAGGRT